MNSEKSIAQLYDPSKMPIDLKEAHNKNDLAIEKCYRDIPFSNDNERLKYLFSLYERMIELEQVKIPYLQMKLRRKERGESMPNLVDVKYKQSGKSIATNELGMRNASKGI